MNMETLQNRFLNKSVCFEINIQSDRSQVAFGFIFTVSGSGSQFRIPKSNTKMENLKVILLCKKKETYYFQGQNINLKGV